MRSQRRLRTPLLLLTTPTRPPRRPPRRRLPLHSPLPLHGRQRLSRLPWPLHRPNTKARPIQTRATPDLEQQTHNRTNLDQPRVQHAPIISTDSRPGSNPGYRATTHHELRSGATGRKLWWHWTQALTGQCALSNHDAASNTAPPLGGTGRKLWCHWTASAPCPTKTQLHAPRSKPLAGLPCPHRPEGGRVEPSHLNPHSGHTSPTNPSLE
jgi:hypothetical protein